MTEGPYKERVGRLYGKIRLQLSSGAKHEVLQTRVFFSITWSPHPKQREIIGQLQVQANHVYAWNMEWWWERVETEHSAENVWVSGLAAVVSEVELVIWVWLTVWDLTDTHTTQGNANGRGMKGPGV